ncbi:hypothetical protein NPIL_346961 [Nephila pilipes]|uniref:Uncharacterized protein n=1 Tax=Nephila pilipes TaxID=299642 RepID=A0A8X6Q0U9_NEPPI|nr:hypothetical protein NPIL_346961 [Nephila pilipes]
MNGAAGSGVHSRLFSQYSPVGKYLTNFGAEAQVIFFLAVTNLQLELDLMKRMLILISRSTIETIALQHLSESLIASKIKTSYSGTNYERQNCTVPMDIITCGHRW